MNTKEKEEDKPIVVIGFRLKCTAKQRREAGVRLCGGNGKHPCKQCNALYSGFHGGYFHDSNCRG